MKTIGLIKLGGTTISAGKTTESDGYEQTGLLIAQKLKKYEKLVCVVSAYAGVTDNLLRRAKDITSEPDARALDFLLSTGEMQSAALLGILLRSRGIQCEVLSGWQVGIYTNSHFGKASIHSIDKDIVRSKLIDTDVVIITGFQGVSSTGDITTLGRGGSDTSAIALGIALEIQDCEIITDVDGIFTANPKIVSGARLIKKIDHELAMEMSSSGAKVIDARAVELAKRHKYEFTISHFNNENGGETNIVNEKTESIGITLNKQCSIINIIDIPNRPGSVQKVIESISRQKTNVGFLYQSFSAEEYANVKAVVWESEESVLANIANAIQEEFDGSQIELNENAAAVSLIGRDIMRNVGTMNRAMKLMSERSIRVEGIGTSSSRITLIIERTKSEDALVALHQEFAEGS